MYYVSLSDVSKYRTHLMGLSAILILLVHAYVHWKTILSPIICKVLEQGNYGVDIFFFVSGVGLTYSISKIENDRVLTINNITTWLKHRYKKILLPYCLITLLYVVICVIIERMNIMTGLLNIITFSYWITGHGAWFISILVLLYFFTPLLYIFLYKWRYGIWLAVIMGMTIMALCQYEVMPLGIQRNVAMSLIRVPSFLLGIAMTGYIKDGIKIKVSFLVFYTIAITIITIILKVIFPFMYSKWMLIVPVIIFLIYLIKRFNYIKILSFFWGPISLESYLYNIYLDFWVNRPIIVFGIDINKGNIFEYLLLVVGGGSFLAYITHQVVLRILKK